MDAPSLFPGSLEPIYVTLRALLLGLDDGVIDKFKKTQVSFGLARKFAWLTPLTKSKALLVIDMWHHHDHSMLRNVTRYRLDKFTEQIEVRTAADIDEVSRLDWFEEAASWGRRQQPEHGEP